MTTVAKPSTAPLFPTKSVSDFAFADFLATEYQFGLDPNRPWCKDFKEGQCDKGNACPEKHNTTPSKNNLVCKHWLRGLCKMGDQCVYLHEFNLRRMPECTHYSRTLSCPNGEECLYQHVDPVTKLAPCPNYEQGFCPLGTHCSKKHIRREMCRYWLAGFCPNGRQCKEGEHPKYRDDLPKPTPRIYRSEQELEAERQQIRETAEKQEDRGWGSRGLPRGDLRRNRGRGGGGFGQNADGGRFQGRR